MVLWSFLLSGAPFSNHSDTELQTLGIPNRMCEKDVLRSAVQQLFPPRAGSRHFQTLGHRREADAHDQFGRVRFSPVEFEKKVGSA